jgi:hypothetical protein
VFGNDEAALGLAQVNALRGDEVAFAQYLKQYLNNNKSDIDYCELALQFSTDQGYAALMFLKFGVEHYCQNSMRLMLLLLIGGRDTKPYAAIPLSLEHSVAVDFIKARDLLERITTKFGEPVGVTVPSLSEKHLTINEVKEKIDFFEFLKKCENSVVNKDSSFCLRAYKSLQYGQYKAEAVDELPASFQYNTLNSLKNALLNGIHEPDAPITNYIVQARCFYMGVFFIEELNQEKSKVFIEYINFNNPYFELYDELYYLWQAVRVRGEHGQWPWLKTSLTKLFELVRTIAEKYITQRRKDVYQGIHLIRLNVQQRKQLSRMLLDGHLCLSKKWIEAPSWQKERTHSYLKQFSTLNSNL